MHIAGRGLCSFWRSERGGLEYSEEIEWRISFIAAFSDGTIAGARFDEPLIVGISNDGYYVSSDVVGFLNYTDEQFSLTIETL